MNLLLVKATFKPNYPVCEGYLIAAVPYSNTTEETYAHITSLAKSLGFYNPEPQTMAPLAELSTDLLYPEYTAFWEDIGEYLVSYANGEY